MGLTIMDNKIDEFLQKLAPCIERGELEACVEEAARIAGEMGIGAKELLSLSLDEYRRRKDDSAYVLALAAALGFEGNAKAPAYFHAGQAAHSAEKMDKAEEQYKQAIAVDPKYVAAYLNYAMLLKELNRKEEAEERYKQAISAGQIRASGRNDYATLLKELNRKEEAEEQYKQAIAADPKNVAVHNNYAMLLKELNRKEEAEEQYKQAIVADPKNVVVHNNYANFLRENTRFYEAEKEVRTALQIMPEDPYALGTLGDILADEDFFEEAIKEYQKALKNPASMWDSAISEIRNNIGWAYAQLKQYKKAKKEFQNAQNLDPLNVKARRNLRKLSKVEIEHEISLNQKFLGILLLISLSVSFGLFWINRLTETVFTVQIIFLVASLIFILLFHQIKRFKAGTVEFEMSSEHRSIEAKSQPSEFER